ncbi:ChaN family lipoprotein [uncultured Xylophilus sp.]|uniref:ChaN family lipoprotein n=1 Tax=uncultured Xylophilus sp. TaxID=296832 RepID=UPI0025DDDE5A|nr:ChaN family lipoprotein [uncultured Xylophilus sp.]
MTPILLRTAAPSATLRAAVRGCAGAALLAAAVLAAGCVGPGPADSPRAVPPRTDILLIGERHDAPGQPALAAEAVRALAADGRLAVLALEMAPEGTSTVALPAGADEAAARSALAWDERAWPWERYAPAVMAAVAARVPVVGANLPAARLRTAMADVSLDAQLTPEARALQETAIRDGHCGLLPERQIGPMTRVQVARDRIMAHVLAQSVRPEATAVLLAGAGHVDRRVGVPQHLPTHLSVRAVAMVAAGDGAGAPAAFTAVWPSPPAPATDHCAALREKLPPARRTP